jgi:tetratricopeptide (TPR) repeat protein
MADDPASTRTDHPDRQTAATSHLGDAAAATSGAPAPVQEGVTPPSTARYLIGHMIARGGMGVVYQANDGAFGREVAIKVLHERFSLDSGAARRFADEARITGQLQHPAIPPVHDVGTLPDGRPFLAMKLIRGRTLEALLGERNDPANDRGRLLAAFEQICQAVAYAHDRDVIHRDLKPANIMVGNYGEVQVMDWGLAKVITRGARVLAARDPEETRGGTAILSLRESDGDFTQAGSVIGTPAYMPPEQAVGAVGKIDARSDVFGLGAVLAVILTGKPPFAGASAETVRIKAAQGDVAECFARLDGCRADPGLVGLCKRCLARDMEERPANAGEVARAVAGLRAAAEERARRAEIDRAAAEFRAAEQGKRWRLRATLAAVILFAGVSFFWYSDRQATAERERLTRNGAAVGGLLDQCAEALNSGDEAKAGVTLESAQKRAAEGGAEDAAGRLEQLHVDLTTLRDLDAIDQFRWRVAGNRRPDDAALAARYREALGRFGVGPESTTADEAAARISRSAVRDRLTPALDRWLQLERPAWVRSVLKLVDPDQFRNDVRDAVFTADQPMLAELAARPEAGEQPSNWIAVMGENRAIPVARRRNLLMVAVRDRPGELGLLMTLGTAFPLNYKEGAEQRVRWLQAAAALAPGNAIVHNNLGLALHDAGDLPGAVGEYKAAIRLDPQLAVVHSNLGWTYWIMGDRAQAVFHYRQALQIDPKNAYAHQNLGWALWCLGDVDEGVKETKQALEIDPTLILAHRSLGQECERTGDFAGAILEYKAALRIDPNYSYARKDLARAERLSSLLPRLSEVAVGRAEPASAAEACGFADLCAQPFQKRWAASARLYEEAFRLDQKLATDLRAGHRYNAACAAAIAGCGGGVDAPSDAGEQAALRGKALAWLRADFALNNERIASASATERQSAAEWLTNCLQDTDFSGTRPGVRRIGMPAAERAVWAELWAEVRAMLTAARTTGDRL